MRTLKTPRTQAILLCLAVMALTVFTFTPQSFAGGSDGYKVTVDNPTDIWVKVQAAKSTVPSISYTEPAMIFGRYSNTMDGHYTHTFTIEGMCPAGLKGEFSVPGKDTWRKLRSADCEGNDCTESRFSACCSDLSFKICRKAGEDGVDYRDGEFGFCPE